MALPTTEHQQALKLSALSLSPPLLHSFFLFVLTLSLFFCFFYVFLGSNIVLTDSGRLEPQSILNPKEIELTSRMGKNMRSN